MGIFKRSQQHRVAAGRTFGRELAHAEHKGWRKLVLLRHGQTDFNVQHRLPGQLSGIPLNATGQHEARTTAESIRSLPFTAIVASPLERTMETATFVNEGRGLEIRQDRDLLDTDYGPYNGRNWDELDKADPAWKRYARDPTTTPPKGVEPFAAVQRRAVRAAEHWRQATDVGEWVALVTHADLVKMRLLPTTLASHWPIVRSLTWITPQYRYSPSIQIPRSCRHYYASTGHRRRSGSRSHRPSSSQVLWRTQRDCLRAG
jgi:broad specificity phosphatase PhoE